MLKDEAGFVSMGYKFLGLEGKNLEYNFPLVGSVKSWKVPKLSEGGF